MTYTVEERGYETPCFVWQGAKSGHYGWASRERTFAHRSEWMKENGPIPSGYHIHHLCEVKLCVRPDHMTLVTRTEHRKVHPHTGPRNRLTIEQVNDIRTSPLSLGDMAMKYDLSKPYVSMVRRGLAPEKFRVAPENLPYRPPTPPRYWNKGKTRLSAAAVRDIRNSKLSLSKVAKKHGITKEYASQIRRGKALAHI